MCPAVISIVNKGIIMKILKYVHSYTMHVDIISPLTKVIPILFECVTTYYQTLKTMHTLYCNYHAFSLNVEFGAICNALPRVTVKFIKKYILIFFLKK